MITGIKRNGYEDVNDMPGATAVLIFGTWSAVFLSRWIIKCCV
jgi:hypothetical protein